MQTTHELQPGDILSSSWGWNQTNVDYYEVTRLAGRTMAVLRPIRQTREYSRDYGIEGGTCLPIPGAVFGAEIRRKVHDGDAVEISSFSCAFKETPNEKGEYRPRVWTGGR